MVSNESAKELLSPMDHVSLDDSDGNIFKNIFWRQIFDACLYLARFRNKFYQ